jgi:hypothetical protein
VQSALKRMPVSLARRISVLSRAIIFHVTTLNGALVDLIMCFNFTNLLVAYTVYGCLGNSGRHSCQLRDTSSLNFLVLGTNAGGCVFYDKGL